MTRQIVKHTSQAYVLSLNIVTQDDTGLTFSTIPLVRLTGLIFTVYTVLQVINRQWVTAQTLPQAALEFCESFYLFIEACRKPLQKILVVNYQGGIL
jgi:hypothetical protein